MGFSFVGLLVYLQTTSTEPYRAVVIQIVLRGMFVRKMPNNGGVTKV